MLHAKPAQVRFSDLENFFNVAELIDCALLSLKVYQTHPVLVRAVLQKNIKLFISLKFIGTRAILKGFLFSG